MFHHRGNEGPSRLPSLSHKHCKVHMWVWSVATTVYIYIYNFAVPPVASRKSSTYTKSKVLLKRRNLVLALVVCLINDA